MAHIYAITNATKSSGKTTTALNLALCFIAMGKKVLLKSFKTDGKLAEIFHSEDYTQHLLTYKRNGVIKLEDCEYYDYIIVDVDFHGIQEFKEKNTKAFQCIVPFETEFFGFEGLKSFLSFSESNKLEIAGILPVFVKSSEVASTIVEELKALLGNLILDAFIPRNFYLARQFDYEFFDIETFTNKAGITYLNLATELNERNEQSNAAK